MTDLEMLQTFWTESSVLVRRNMFVLSKDEAEINAMHMVFSTFLLSKNRTKISGIGA